MLQLIELNEINFDLVQRYIENGADLPNLKKLLSEENYLSSSESVYENLEPWIQWPSVHTGKVFDEHKVFRLGDAVKYSGKQLFEHIESHGYKVGNLSAMNVANRLVNPAFFVPDPWTNTPSDSSFLSRALSKAISQSVNDNTGGKITLQSAIYFGIASLLLVPPTRYVRIAKKLIWALRKPWRKAMFLDVLLVEYFRTLVKRKRPDFSSLFLNAGAHIQHHYMLSASILHNNHFSNPEWYVEKGADPLLEAYQQYDELIAILTESKSANYIIATALSQTPCEKPVFYYRLSNHASFLKLLKLDFLSVEPRMTRDFLVHFADDKTRDVAVKHLQELKIDGVPIFNKIDKRPNELFVTMDYAQEITSETRLDHNQLLDSDFSMKDHVNFVAIKNGEHQEKGYVFFAPELKGVTFRNGDHVAKLYDVIMSQFPKQDIVTK